MTGEVVEGYEFTTEYREERLDRKVSVENDNRRD